MVAKQRLRHDLIWFNMKQNIHATLDCARLTYLQQEADNRGYYLNKIKR